VGVILKRGRRECRWQTPFLSANSRSHVRYAYSSLEARSPSRRSQRPGIRAYTSSSEALRSRRQAPPGKAGGSRSQSQRPPAESIVPTAQPRRSRFASRGFTRHSSPALRAARQRSGTARLGRDDSYPAREDSRPRKEEASLASEEVLPSLKGSPAARCAAHPRPNNSLPAVRPAARFLSDGKNPSPQPSPLSTGARERMKHSKGSRIIYVSPQAR
jgi:hypothetical protein